MLHFYTPLKHQKPIGFLTFSGGIDIDIRLKWLKDGRKARKFMIFHVNFFYFIAPAHMCFLSFRRYSYMLIGLD